MPRRVRKKMVRVVGAGLCTNQAPWTVRISIISRTRIACHAPLAKLEKVLPPKSKLPAEELAGRPRLNKCPRYDSIAVYSGSFCIDRYFFKSQIVLVRSSIREN